MTGIGLGDMPQSVGDLAIIRAPKVAFAASDCIFPWRLDCQLSHLAAED